jgi:hypothetical protein
VKYQALYKKTRFGWVIGLASTREDTGVCVDISEEYFSFTRKGALKAGKWLEEKAAAPKEEKEKNPWMFADELSK